jgi:hypothetical protein
MSPAVIIPTLPKQTKLVVIEIVVVDRQTENHRAKTTNNKHT